MGNSWATFGRDLHLDLTGPGGLRAALLTPAHQFPTGVPLHPDRCAAAVNWARAAGG
ncbi:hypothetical protein [Streptomyces platensis]|uniref:hypothetical protein n=1 Tax=Streptomyces platensis TaxID=58346 RepID=UPI0036AC33EE